MEKVPDGVSRTEITEELPQGMERRLVLRLLSHWRILCDDRDYPSFFEVDPSAIPEMWENCFVLEIFEDGDEPRFRAMGEKLAAHVDFSLIDQPISTAYTSRIVYFKCHYGSCYDVAYQRLAVLETC